MSEPIAIKAYGGLTRLISPLLRLHLKKRAKAGKEDLARLGERFGNASLSRPDGPLVWLHGASVGETTMLLPLIDEILERPGIHVLVTSGTVTSANLMAKRLPERAFHQYIPADTPGAVTRFLDHWKPDLALWAESEIWPNLIRLTKKRGIPLALINARMSDRSIIRWKKHGVKNARAVFGNFDHILAANTATAEGLRDLLGKDIPMLGNLKNAAPPLPVDEAELARLKKQIGKRPVWCAASTHDGEEKYFVDAHEELQKKVPNALLIAVPRHPGSPGYVPVLTGAKKFAVRSQGGSPNSKTDIYVMDTIGELGLAFSLSDITFMGGSLLEELSGHNPLEPARLANTVLSGPYVASFQETYDTMIDHGAALCVAPDALTQAVSVLMSDPSALAKTQKLAKDFADNQDGVLDAVWERLEPLMPDDKS